MACMPELDEDDKEKGGYKPSFSFWDGWVDDFRTACVGFLFAA